MPESKEKEPDSENKAAKMLSEFCSQHLRDHREIKIFLKSKRYARVGLYISGFVWYIVLAFYFSNDISILDAAFIGPAVLAPTSSLITILLYLNRRRYGFTQEDITYHEVAALIESYKQQPEGEEISNRINRFSEIGLDNSNNILPKAWKEELGYYFSYLEGEDEDTFYDTFETVAVPLVDSLNKLKDIDIEEVMEIEEEETTDQNNEPGFSDVLFDSVNQDYFSKDTLLWFTFIIAAVAGLGLAFLEGQGWGVLLVTIVFGGLRLYDRQTD